MKIYKRRDIIEFEAQDVQEGDQLNWIFGLLSSRSVKWSVSKIGDKTTLIMMPLEEEEST
jgi:hypothetical protein